MFKLVKYGYIIFIGNKALRTRRIDNLKININDDAKVVALWFGINENAKDNLPKDIGRKIDEYREKKYKICMYQSGNDDIKNNILNLILNNAY